MFPCRATYLLEVDNKDCLRPVEQLAVTAVAPEDGCNDRRMTLPSVFPMTGSSIVVCTLFSRECRFSSMHYSHRYTSIKL